MASCAQAIEHFGGNVLSNTGIIIQMLSAMVLLSLVSCSEPTVISTRAGKVNALSCGESLRLSYKNIRPIIENRCLRCHTGGTRNSMARLSDIQRVAGLAHIQVRDHLMPTDFPLEPGQQKLLTAWLALGAPADSTESLPCEKVPSEAGAALPPVKDELLPTVPGEPVTYLMLRERVLARKCLTCHSPTGDAFLYDFTNFESMALSPGLFDLNAPEKSLIVLSVQKVGRGEMPPPRSQIPRLTVEEVDILQEWIVQGLRP